MEIHDQVWAYLKTQINENEEFRNLLRGLLHFYGRKLMNYAKKEEHELLIEKELETIMHAQFFQGYYVMKEILADTAIELEESSWKQPKGLLRNELPAFIDATFSQQQLDWTRTEEGHMFGMKVLREFEGAYETVKQFRRELANFGAFQAFIEDERYQEPIEEKDPMYLGNPIDLNFISPQVYLQALTGSTEHELWDLFFWSAHYNNTWVGSIHYSHIPLEPLPFALLEIKLSQLITFDEQTDIINTLVGKFPSDIRETLQIRFYKVEDMDILRYEEQPVNTL